MKKILLGLALLFLSSAVALGQRTITGKVMSEEGEPLIGVTITAPGTSAGTQTDINGVYRITVPENASALRFVYTGHDAQEVPLTDATTYDVSLQPTGSVIQDIVVVGYGTQQKRAITGTISTIKGRELAEIPAQSFDQLLQGRVPGVNVNLPNGVLNNQPVFRVRGINSINLSSFPLVVVDGIPTFTATQGNNAGNNPLASINPNDIESIDILKDASATAIYGSRASAGVVLITTKRGAKGRSRVNYDVSVAWQKPARLFDLLNAEQYVELKNEALRNNNVTAQQYFLDTLNGQLIDTDWSDYLYRTGFQQTHNLGISGGSDQTTYYLSMNYTDQEGMIVRNAFQRYGGRFNLDHKIGQRIKVGGQIAYGNQFNEAPNTGSLPGEAFNTGGLGRLAFVLAPIVGPYNADGSYNIANNQLGRGKNLQQTGFVNPQPLIDLNSFTSEANQLQGSIYGELEILKGLSLKTQYGLDNINVENLSFQTPVHGDGFSQNGLAQNTYIRLKRWNWQNLLNYQLNLNERHVFGITLGNEMQHTISEGWGAVRTQIADPFFTTYQGNYTTINPAGNFQGENYLLSYFGRLNYEFNRRYYLSVNIRQDEYSAFAEGEKLGVFWGASAGWAISEEGFWKNSIGDILNFFKIRGSYGTVGNNQGLGDFASFSLYGSGLYGANPTIFFSQAGNPSLSWETSEKTDVGIVFGLFNDRIQGEYTYFKNLIDGLILNTPQSPSKGIPGNSVAVNIGSMENIGHEIGLSATIIRNKIFEWKSDFNITLMKNEVLSLDDQNRDIFGSTSTLETANIIRVGESIGSLYVVQTNGVNPENGRRIYLKRNTDGTFYEVQYNHAAPSSQRWTRVDDGSVVSAANVAADGVVFGPVLPTWYGGWNNTFKLFGFDLSVQLNYAGGNYVYNGSKAGLRDQRFWNNHTDVLDRWTENNTDGKIPRLVYGDNISNGSAFPISENVEKADFVRVRNITLGYKVPTRLIDRAKISSLRVYANVNNAFLFTDYTGTDPEVSTNGNSNLSPGVDRNSVPMARTFTFGLTLGL